MMESHWEEKLVSLKVPVNNEQINTNNEENNSEINQNKDNSRNYSKSLKICINDAIKKNKKKIYDNIWEDITVYKPKKYSMKTLKSKIIYNNLINGKNKNNIQKKQEKETTKEKINNNHIKIKEEKNYSLNNNSDKFNDIIKLKREKSPIILKEQWKFEKILLDYNIIDFTCKQNKIIIINNII